MNATSLLTNTEWQEGWTPEDTDRVLNCESGWRGLSGGIDNMAKTGINCKGYQVIQGDY